MKKGTKKPTFSLTLLVGDTTYKSSGSTLRKALDKFQDTKPGGKMWLTVEKDGKDMRIMFNQLRWKLLFFKPMFFDVFEKKVELFLK